MKRLLIAVVMMAGCAMAQDAKASTELFKIDGVGTSIHPTFVIGRSVDDNYKWEPMVTIDLTAGKVTFGKDYRPDEASEMFWQYVSHDSPTALKRRIAELEAEVAELRRKEVAGATHY